MFRQALTGSLFCLGLLVAIAFASAQAPPAPIPAPPPSPEPVVRVAFGWIFLDAPGMIVRVSRMGGATTVITNSGNGVGNRIVVNNGGAPGVTILGNVRNGVGNSIIVTPSGPVIELPRPMPPRP